MLHSFLLIEWVDEVGGGDEGRKCLLSPGGSALRSEARSALTLQDCRRQARAIPAAVAVEVCSRLG